MEGTYRSMSVSGFNQVHIYIYIYTVQVPIYIIIICIIYHMVVMSS